MHQQVNLPFHLVLLYFFAVLSIVFREIVLIVDSGSNEFMWVFYVLQFSAKQNVGLITTMSIAKMWLGLRSANRREKKEIDDIAYSKEQACIEIV